MKRYMLECLIGLVFALAIAAAAFMTATDLPFVYQGF